VALINSCTYTDCVDLSLIRNEGPASTEFRCYIQVVAQETTTRLDVIAALDRTPACGENVAMLEATRFCDPAAFGISGWDDVRAAFNTTVAAQGASSADSGDEFGVKHWIVASCVIVALAVLVVGLFLLWKRQQTVDDITALTKLKTLQYETALQRAEALARKKQEDAAEAQRPKVVDPYTASFESGDKTVMSYVSMMGNPIFVPAGQAPPAIDDCETLEFWETSM
jgi:hypothetical protein